MTPLAQDFTNDLLLPLAKRQWRDDGDLGSGILDYHFFDCTNVFDMAVDLAETFSKRRIPDTLAFLPADKTWIEYLRPDGLRVAILLKRNGEVAEMSIAIRQKGRTPSLSKKAAIVPLADNPVCGDHWWTVIPQQASAELVKKFDRTVANQVFLAYAFLAMINTPRVIGRRQHMPHRGLEKRLTAERGMVGKFPLRAWTEMVLEVSPPKIDESDPHEAHFTGTKALHFVRCHLRLVNGALSLVSPHWRGDPALGIVKTRYRLEPPEARAA